MSGTMREDTEYAGQRVALLTQHGKEAIIGPPLSGGLGCHVERVAGYDTDLLGSFTRERPRPGTQLAAAREKARIGMQLGGTTLAVASEGAFCADPHGGFVPWNVELVLFVDATRALEVIGVAQGPARVVQRAVGDRSALAIAAAEAGFPEHGLVLRPDHAEHADMRKGLRDEAALYAAFDAARGASTHGLVFVESDLRAHMNPSRQDMIAAATADLLRRLASRCPRCAARGFDATAVVPGLPCALCGTPTRLPVATRWCCAACGHEERRAAEVALADPARCDRCNP